MNCASISVPATAASLKSLITNIPNEVAILILQCPQANANLVYFGNSAIQTFELDSGDPFYYVPAEVQEGRIDTTLLYIKGTAPDKLSVMWVELYRSK